MKYYTSVLIASLLAFAACSKQPSDSGSNPPHGHIPEQIESVPYDTDLKASGAILTRYHVIVYFVANSNRVIQIALPVPDTDQAQTRIPIGDQHNTSAILHTGPNVAHYVIPSGGASPTPPADQESYSHSKATGGFITYSCTNPKDTLPPECSVGLSIDQLDFDEGILYSIDEQTFRALPPPP